jgi:hypothetical protein
MGINITQGKAASGLPVRQRRVHLYDPGATYLIGIRAPF